MYHFIKNIYHLPEQSVGVRMSLCALPAAGCSPGATFSNESAPGCHMGQQKPMFFDHAIFNFS